MPLSPLGVLSNPVGAYRSFQALQKHGGMRTRILRVLRQVLLISAESKLAFLSSVDQISDKGTTLQTSNNIPLC